MNKLFYSIIFTCISFSNFLFSQEIDKIIAIIGEEIILKSDLEISYAQVKAQFKDQEISKCDALEGLVTDKLIIHKSKEDSLFVTEEEVKYELEYKFNELLKEAGGEKQLEEKFLLSADNIKSEMSKKMIEARYVQKFEQLFNEDISVSPSEIKDFFKTIPKNQLPQMDESMKIAQLVVDPFVSKETKDKVILQLNEIKKEIASGKSDFKTQALFYSEDPGSSSSGGEILGVTRGNFAKNFEAVAFNIEQGVVSDPFETEFGFHILEVLNRDGEKIDVRHILIKPKPTEIEKEKTVNKLDSLKTLISQGKTTFEELVKKYSIDKSTKQNGGVIRNSNTGFSYLGSSEIDTDTYIAINDLKVGGISEPFETVYNRNNVYKLVKLIDEIPPHQLNLEQDYQRLKFAAKRNKSLIEMKKWSDENLKKVNLEIKDEELKSCPQIISALSKN